MASYKWFFTINITSIDIFIVTATFSVIVVVYIAFTCFSVFFAIKTMILQFINLHWLPR